MLLNSLRDQVKGSDGGAGHRLLAKLSPISHRS
jgi:hypothetical protein